MFFGLFFVGFRYFQSFLRSLRLEFLMIEPLRNLRNFFFGWTPLGVWMLLPRDAWAKLLKNTGFTNLDYIYEMVLAYS